MKKHPVILDLETKHTFRDVDKHKKLGVSVACLYDYADNTSHVFIESELNKIFAFLEKASYIVGFNVKNFDLQVLQAYYPGDITQFPVFDICDDLKERSGRRPALNDILRATLGKKKSGHGLIAIDHFRNGQWEELKKYCSDDVMLTKEIFDYGIKEGCVFTLNEKGKRRIEVDWKRYLDHSNNTDISLTLPF